MGGDTASCTVFCTNIGGETCKEGGGVVLQFHLQTVGAGVGIGVL